jgi:hypothetical protein
VSCSLLLASCLLVVCALHYQELGVHGVMQFAYGLHLDKTHDNLRDLCIYILILLQVHAQ